MPDRRRPDLSNVDEAVAPYFSAVYVEMVSLVQALAFYSLIQQNVVPIPFWSDWNWPYFLRGITVFLLVISLWHRYVTQLAYIATLHWLHTLFPFVFGVLQFMLASPHVLKPSTDMQNLSYFLLLMTLTALTGVLAHTNAVFQHRSNRTKLRFALTLGKHAKDLHSFWQYLHMVFAALILAIFLVFLALSCWAHWAYARWEEYAFPGLTALLAFVTIHCDARYCAKHSWAPEPVRIIYTQVYGKTFDWNTHG